MESKMIPSWDICLLSGNTKRSGVDELSNALLYGDKVIWLPSDVVFISSLYSLVYAKGKKITKLAEGFDRERLDGCSEAAKQTLDGIKEDYGYIAAQIHKNQLPIIIPEDILRGPEFSNIQIQELSDAELIKKEILQVAMEEIVEFWHKEIPKKIQKTSACIQTSDHLFKISSHWDVRKAAQLLMNKLSEIYFPNVSSLPLLEVVELKDKVKDELNPMRAEMLRLTEELRKMVKDESSEEEVAREAENLIRTRVEPVVREVNKHIREQLNSRWRKFAGKGLKSIGLGGFALISGNLNLSKDALKEAIGMVAEVAAGEGKYKLPTATSHFVLEIRQHYGSKYNY